MAGRKRQKTAEQNRQNRPPVNGITQAENRRNETVVTVTHLHLQAGTVTRVGGRKTVKRSRIASGRCSAARGGKAGAERIPQAVPPETWW